MGKGMKIAERTLEEQPEKQPRKQSGKKMNTYLKYGLFVMGSALIGGGIGFFIASGEEYMLRLPELFLPVRTVAQKLFLPEMILLLITALSFGEYTLRRLKRLIEQNIGAEEEEGDRLDYEMERASGWGTVLMSVLDFLSVLLLAFSYSLEYIRETAAEHWLEIIAGFFIFVLFQIYHGYWSIRHIRLAQKYDPAKKGDPSSLKFSEQWAESCDEAEKAVIYQSSFAVYTTLSRWVPMLLVTAMLMHLIWNTGITAICFVGVIQLILCISYVRNCVQKKKYRLYR